MIFGRKLGGFVRIRICGECGTALLDRLAQRDISLWDLQRDGEDIMVCVSPDDLGALRCEAHAAGCFVSVEQRGGVSSLRKYWQGRLPFLGVAAVAFFLLIGALSFFWQVDVATEDGTTLTAEQETAILDAAAAGGIRVPMLRSSLDHKATAKSVLERCSFLSWVGLESDGVTLRVKVAKKKTDDGENATYGHVVAQKDGKVRRIFVLKGQMAAEIGDEVQKGDVLISGDIVYEEDGQEPVYEKTAAKGTVTASVFYEGIAYVPLVRSDAIPTGKTAGIVGLKGHGMSFVLWGNEADPFDCSVKKERAVSLFGWTLWSRTYCEATPQKVKIGEAEALALAEKQAEAKSQKQRAADSRLLHRQREELRDRDGAVGVCIILECEEEIGKFTSLP
ncbi:MAG: sporulation protein YqfD [Firmicutes bacterium]|nr:sporulation protein YqfD [Bacillota bacterium]